MTEDMLDVRQVLIDELLEMRERILTPGHPGRDVVWPYDATAEHYGMYIGSERIACVSLTQQEMPGKTAVMPFHLHSMAVEPARQARGHGRELLTWLVTEVQRSGGDLVWATARPSAVEFYRRCGFDVSHDVILPHTRARMTYVWRAL